MADSTDGTITFHNLWNVWYWQETPCPVTELPVQFNLLLELVMYNLTQLSAVSLWKQQQVFLLSLTHNFHRCVLIDLMPSSHNKDINASTTKKRKCSCGVCGMTAEAVALQCRKTETLMSIWSNHWHPPRDDQGTDLKAQPTHQNDPVVLPQLGHCLYCVLDLETTGLSRAQNHIVEVAAQILKHNGVPLDNGSFELLVWPPTNIPSFIGTLIGITDKMVKSSEYFTSIMSDFLKKSKEGKSIVLYLYVIMVWSLTYPFLMSELKRNDLFALLNHCRYGYTIDTYL